MAMQCYNCGKGILYGHNVSHSKRRTKRVFRPNLHQAKILVGNNRKSVRLCTKCQRLYKKLEKMQNAPVEVKEESTVTSPASL